MKSITYATLLGTLLGLLTACGGEPPTRSDRARQAVPVVVAPVRIESLRTRIEAVGTARARRSVSLFAESAGEVVAVNFQPGDRVQRGDVLLALDAREQRLALELAELRLDDAQRLLSRYTGANAASDRTVPETTVDEARTAMETARIARDQARLALDRRFVRAPFDGYVGITDIDAGDRVDTTTAITTMDDRSVLLVSFAVPEAFVGRVDTGDAVRIEAWNADRSLASGRVVDLDSRVDPLSRSFITRAEVPNETDRLRPGMSFRVRLDLTGAEYPAVPEVAVQWGPDGAYVWAVRDSEARRVPVRLVQREQGQVLVEGDLPRGTQIVGEGMQSMREGLAVRSFDASALARDARGTLAPAANGS